MTKFKQSFVAMAVLAQALAMLAVPTGPAQAKEAPAAQRSILLSEGTSFAAAVSPDGKWVAFDLHGRLWLVSQRGGDARQISDGLDDARLPAWSPDGRALAYQRYHDGNWQIWSLDIASGATRPLTEGKSDNRDAVWSPDGAYVYFASDRSHRFAIWRKNLSSGAIESVLEVAGNAVSPAVAADGSLAYIVRPTQRGQASQVIVRNPKGDSVEVHEGKEGVLTGLSWIAPGHLALVSFDNSWSSQKVELLGIDVGAANVQPLTPPDEDVFPFRASADAKGGMVYASNGKIWFRESNGRSRVVPFRARVDLVGPKAAHRSYDFSPGRTIAVKGIVDPVVAPAGNEIAFVALGDLWTARQGEAPRRITNDRHVDLEPIYSPDGKQLAWVSERSGRMQIWLRDLATGAERRLETPGEVMGINWKPDGKTLSFVQKLGGRAGLSTIDLETGKIAPITGDGGEGKVSWSPDGSRYATMKLDIGSTVFREGRNAVMIVETADGKQKELPLQPGMLLGARDQSALHWSPDGRHIAAVMDRDAWIFPVDAGGTLTGAPRMIARNIDGSLSWTGDSRYLLAQSGTSLTRVAIDGSGGVDMTPRITVNARPGEGRKVLRAGRLFDGVAKDYARNVDILIEDNRIAALVPAGSPQSAAFGGTLIDASDKAVVPGLMDIHAHVNSRDGARPSLALLAYGVTTIRSPASDPYASLDYREALATGNRKGPRLFFTGFPIEGSRVFYPAMRSYATDAGLAHDFKLMKDLDYDFIKTYVRLENDVQKKVIDYAARNNFYVTSHEFLPAAAIGAAGKEHLKGTSREGYGTALSLRSRVYSDVAAISKASGMRITPTLALLVGLAQEYRTRPENFTDWRFKDLLGPAEAERFTNDLKRSYPSDPERLTRSVNELSVSLKKIVDGGGHIVAGTDCPLLPCGISLLNELDVATGPGGLAPYQAIQYATAWSADAMGLGDQLGRIKPGMLADLLIVDGDPLARTADLRKLDAVVADGEYLPLTSPVLRTPFKD